MFISFLDFSKVITVSKLLNTRIVSGYCWRGFYAQHCLSMRLPHILIISFSVFFATGLKSQLVTTAIQGAGNELVFASDTQAPIWIEALWLQPHRNRVATKKIFNSITEKQPKAVFLLGDVVSVGCSNKQWRRMDGYLKKLRDKGVKVNATLGNHDLMFKAEKGRRKFVERFPNYVNTGFVEVEDSVAVILLNSNYKFLSKNEDTIQLNWYRNTLQRLDDDSAIQFVITGCHHSPYSNSKFIGSSEEVRRKFARLFLQSKKGRLFLSGHTHAYEHFKVEGKDFLVIGGGGGLHENLKNNNRLKDIDSAYKPMYHYLTIKRQVDKLQITSIKLKHDFSGFEEGVKFEINKTTEIVPYEVPSLPVVGLVGSHK